MKELEKAGGCSGISSGSSSGISINSGISSGSSSGISIGSSSGSSIKGLSRSNGLGTFLSVMVPVWIIFIIGIHCWACRSKCGNQPCCGARSNKDDRRLTYDANSSAMPMPNATDDISVV